MSSSHLVKPYQTYCMNGHVFWKLVISAPTLFVFLGGDPQTLSSIIKTHRVQGVQDIICIIMILYKTIFCEVDVSSQLPKVFQFYKIDFCEFHLWILSAVI
jgi:hypothetical protein